MREHAGAVRAEADLRAAAAVRRRPVPAAGALAALRASLPAGRRRAEYAAVLGGPSPAAASGRGRGRRWRSPAMAYLTDQGKRRRPHVERQVDELCTYSGSMTVRLGVREYPAQNNDMHDLR